MYGRWETVVSTAGPVQRLSATGAVATRPNERDSHDARPRRTRPVGTDTPPVNPRSPRRRLCGRNGAADPGATLGAPTRPARSRPKARRADPGRCTSGETRRRTGIPGARARQAGELHRGPDARGLDRSGRAARLEGDAMKHLVTKQLEEQLAAATKRAEEAERLTAIAQQILLDARVGTMWSPARINPSKLDDLAELLRRPAPPSDVEPLSVPNAGRLPVGEPA